jgi:hypothetical protein
MLDENVTSLPDGWLINNTVKMLKNSYITGKINLIYLIRTNVLF